MASELRSVLVTGASGTVGGAVVDALLAHGGYAVHAVSRRPLPNRSRLISHAVDLCAVDFELALAVRDYDAIVHAAQPRAEESYAASSGEDFDIHVVRGLERLGTARTRHWLYTSGVWVYGHQSPGERITESSPLCPFAAAVSRLAVLEHLRGANTPPWVEVVLPSLVYGLTGPLLAIAEQIRADAALAIDDPAICWSLIEQSDVGSLYRLLLEKVYHERRFVAAEPEAMAIRDVYQRVAAALGRPFRPQSRATLRQQVADEAFEIMTAHQPVDSTLAEQRLGWTPRHRFRPRVAALLG